MLKKFKNLILIRLDTVDVPFKNKASKFNTIHS